MTESEYNEWLGLGAGYPDITGYGPIRSFAPQSVLDPLDRPATLGGRPLWPPCDGCGCACAGSVGADWVPGTVIKPRRRPIDWTNILVGSVVGLVVAAALGPAVGRLVGKGL